MNRLLVVLLMISLLSMNASAYGPRGHQLVGAVADRRLKKNQAIANKVRDLLDGMTLQRAATLPDEIKGWKCGDNQSRPNRIDRELQAFVNANCKPKPSHTFFHFTDVPVAGNEKYADGDIGRADVDIVHMIPFCIQVLKGEVPETNDHAITKSVAVILLTHYLGDIHQPLHVGAEFFNADGKPFEPTVTNKGFEDQGGNKLTLFTFIKGKKVSAGNFHSYWDGQTVENAFGNTQNSKVAQRLAAKEPDDWKLNGGIETWAEQLANDILPIAREAHSRLQYSNIVIEPGQRDITSGRADEKKKQSGGTFYAVWASGVVKEEIHKGGWRLAALLEQALQ
jgi:hypothetical protein